MALSIEEVEQSIFEAARKNDYSELKALISTFPTVSVDGYLAYDGSTALLMACRYGASLEVVELLIENGGKQELFYTFSIDDCLFKTGGTHPQMCLVWFLHFVIKTFFWYQENR